MSNGVVPMDLLPADYETIKDGDCATSGNYEGCIAVEGLYYWVSRGQDAWELSKGNPDQSQVKITEEVWSYCKSGGTYTYDGQEHGWYDEQQLLHKWNGAAGGEISLEEV